jgi:osmoprotectant transport system substrate-binding protein
VAVGVGAAVEQRVLAALTLVALERAGIGVRAVEAGDAGGPRRQAEAGDVDLFWDYSGAALSLELLPRQPPPAVPEESFERVARADEQRNGFIWLGPTQANATLALFVRAGEVAETDRTLTWLSRRLSEGGSLCADPDFLTRQGGLPSLAEEYSIALGSLVEVPAPEAEAITRVASGECFAGLATATSGAAQEVGLVPVADDLGVFPAFIAAPVVRAPVLEAEPAIRDALAPLSSLTTDQLRQLNGRVEAGEDARAVAEEVLASRFAPAT